MAAATAPQKRGRFLLDSHINPRALEVLQDELAVRALREYVPLIWPTLMTGTELIRGWYLDAIADHCEALKRFLLGEPGGIQRLLISLMARSGKSIYTNIGLPSWLWLWDPRVRIFSASHDQTLSTRDTWATRRLMQHPLYQRLIRHQHDQRGAELAQRLLKDHTRAADMMWRFEGDQNVKSFYANSLGGWRMGTQVGSGTGQGGRLLLIDDPLSIDGAQSDTITKTANDWLFQTVWSRQDDPDNTAIGITAHRTREDDPTGTAIAKDLGFEYLSLPLTYDPATRARATVIMFQDPRSKYGDEGPNRWTHQDPRTEKGQILEPRRWSQKWVETTRKSLDILFEALANQNPQKSGLKPIRREMLHRWIAMPEGGFRKIAISADTSFRGEDPTDKRKTEGRSMTAVHVWGFTDTHAYLLDRDTRHMGIDDQMDAIEAMMVRWKKRRYTLIEAEANGDALIGLLGKKWKSLIPIDPRGQGSKFARLIAVLPFLRAGNVLFPPDDLAEWVPDLIAALLRFPGRPDDDVDAMTQILRHEWIPDYDEGDTTKASNLGVASILALSR